MENSGIKPEETQFVLKLLAEARSAGIVEIEYKGLRIRLSPRAIETGSGPVTMRQAVNLQRSPLTWNNTLPTPEE